MDYIVNNYRSCDICGFQFACSCETPCDCKTCPACEHRLPAVPVTAKDKIDPLEMIKGLLDSARLDIENGIVASGACKCTVQHYITLAMTYKMLGGDVDKI